MKGKVQRPGALPMAFGLVESDEAERSACHRFAYSMRDLTKALDFVHGMRICSYELLLIS